MKELYKSHSCVFPPLTLSQILIHADNYSDVNELMMCKSEIDKNKHRFTLIEVDFAIEHIDNLINSDEGYIRTKELFMSICDKLFKQ